MYCQFLNSVQAGNLIKLLNIVNQIKSNLLKIDIFLILSVEICVHHYAFCPMELICP